MAESPRISVVMPTLNQARYIAESVRSVLSQGVPGLELLVQDGGSTDGTQAELAALAAAHPDSLRWQSATDSGPAQAVNRAVAASHGAVIGWLNSDDLYEHGAIARALEHLAAAPDDAMVYGQAHHVDDAGAVLGVYPTQAPQVGLAEFARGCFICQPSAFVRRPVWQALGGLDESLRTAFDFDLWLRLFKAWPERIGFIDAPLARSRLHAGSITLRLREQVALEGLAVLHRHLGAAPPEWLLTHFAERCDGHPFDTPPVDLAHSLLRLLERASPWLAIDDAAMLRSRIASDRPLQLASSDLYIAVSPDGWAGPTLEVRLRQPALPLAAVVLRCRHAAPAGGRLRIEVVAPGGATSRVDVSRPGPFEIVLRASARQQGDRLTYLIRCQDSFVPADCAPGSTDTRRLAFLVEGRRLVMAPAAPSRAS